MRVATEQAAWGWWWLVWSVPTGILWETGSVAGTVNDTGASRGVVVSGSPFPASHSHSLPEPEDCRPEVWESWKASGKCVPDPEQAAESIAVHGLPKDIRLVAAGACWSNTGNPGSRASGPVL